MRNCCSTKPASPGSRESRAEVPATAQPSSLEPGAGSRALALTGTGVGPPEKGTERASVAVSCLGQEGLPNSGPLALPDGAGIPLGPAVGSTGPASPRLLPEPCLKGRSKDPGSAPATLKHVAFLDPIDAAPQLEGAGAATASPTPGPGQPGASQGDVSVGSVGAPGAAPLSPCGLGPSGAGAGGRAPVSLAEPKGPLGLGDPALPSSPGGAKELARGTSGAEASSSLGPRGDAGLTPLGRAKETGRPAPLSGHKADAAGATHGVQGQGQPGSQAAEARGVTGPAQKLPRAVGPGLGSGEEAAPEARTVELLSKTYSFELTPPPQDAGTQDAGTQAGSRVSLVSVAISPISPPDGTTAFAFHSRGALQSPGPQLKPSKKDAEMQVSIPVQTRSVATGPMTPVATSPQTAYPEVHVKAAPEEPPEPIREVSWDEKGMTWEVYGATMEVEVLGMAIQKHLEKQIEEHSRQLGMTPQSAQASSIKEAPCKEEAKRPPSMFRALLQSVRRPRCCSRAGPATE